MTQDNYTIGKKISEILKYNINYNSEEVLNYVCYIYINDLLQKENTFFKDKYLLKLRALLNKLRRV